ncbi:hypothetical protein EV177_002572 [Coemansia sp. RSA 1804]|nr:hypothetical protein EV177_002572 [Coemansia sp. RSA 1804]
MNREGYYTRSEAHQRLAQGGGSSGTRHPPLPTGGAKRVTPQSGRRGPPMSTRKASAAAAAAAEEEDDSLAYTEERVGNLTQEQCAEIREVFDSIDTRGRGTVSVSQLGDIIRTLDMNIGDGSGSELQRWRKQIDPKNTGKFTYKRLEELVALLYDEMDQREQMLNAFRLFKPEATNLEDARITLDDLQRVSARLGETIPVDELREMINVADDSGSGSVDFTDFMRMMRKTGLF